MLLILLSLWPLCSVMLSVEVFWGRLLNSFSREAGLEHSPNTNMCPTQRVKPLETCCAYLCTRALAQFISNYPHNSRGRYSLHVLDDRIEAQWIKVPFPGSYFSLLVSHKVHFFFYSFFFFVSFFFVSFTSIYYVLAASLNTARIMAIDRLYWHRT